MTQAPRPDRNGPIEIVAALIRDRAGHMLLVRKRGTQVFMQPGGERDAGEDDATALARELDEELGCRVVGLTHHLGEFVAPSANEPGLQVHASLYAVEVEGTIVPRAEIEEIAWIDPAGTTGIELAPLTRDHVLPLARAIPSRLNGWPAAR
jgi:8-oxo-dGTP diphosphatase